MSLTAPANNYVLSIALDNPSELEEGKELMTSCLFVVLLEAIWFIECRTRDPWLTKHKEGGILLAPFTLNFHPLLKPNFKTTHPTLHL